MSDNLQIDAFAKELNSLVDRFRNEYDLTYAAVIGVLTMKAFDLNSEARESSHDDEDA